MFTLPRLECVVSCRLGGVGFEAELLHLFICDLHAIGVVLLHEVRFDLEASRSKRTS